MALAFSWFGRNPFMSDFKYEPKSEASLEAKPSAKLESIRTTTNEFVSQEKQTITDFSQRVLKDVESLLSDSVNTASTRLTSMFKKVENVVRTEPLVAFTALAITGLAIVNIMRQRNERKAAAPKASPAKDEQTFH
jgi:hypothetical protein